MHSTGDTLTFYHPAGQFKFHQEHGHVHFGNLAQYSIRQYLPGGGVGIPLITGIKIGFCLVDFYEYLADPCCGLKPPGSPPFEVFDGCVSSIPAFQGYFYEGISKGWVDKYGYFLAEQWLDISSLMAAPGVYWLQSVVDPDQSLYQSSLSNDTGRIPVFIVRKDLYEPNDDAAAVNAMPIAGANSSNLSACQMTIDALSIHRQIVSGISYQPDVDYFKIYLADDATASHSVKITFSDLSLTEARDGNLDMEIRYANDTPTGKEGVSDDNDELIPLADLPAGTYYVKVYGRAGVAPVAQSNFYYRLDLVLPSPACGDVNGDGQINTQDVVVLNNYLTSACDGSGSVPPCLGRAEVSGNCTINCEDRDILNAYINGTGQLPGTGCPSCP